LSDDLYLPNPKGRVILTVPTPSLRTTQLLPGWRGFEVVIEEVVVIALGEDRCSDKSF
jgi:hypothetical protein